MGDSPFDLLQEWLDFWSNTDELTPKPPNSLHTRTAVLLTEHKYQVERDVADNSEIKFK